MVSKNRATATSLTILTFIEVLVTLHVANHDPSSGR